MIRAPGLGLLLAAIALAPLQALSQGRPYVVLAAGTTTRDSGLLAQLLPLFEARSGLAVRVIGVGTGRAIELARRGDVDALLVHDPAAEDALLREGVASLRRTVMVNDFLLIGPQEDPAGARHASDAPAALNRVAQAQGLFLSRGDDSGTHKRELALWKATGTAPEGSWYRETGSGMGATLNTASQLDAYTLVDRATWLFFRNRGQLAILYEGDARMRNLYSVLLVSRAAHPHVRPRAQEFADWLVSKEAQAAIRAYTIDGQVLFHPAANPPSEESP
ncbi:MAG: substrate-binding domain-containing protein [Deltaproteobacteria bacterium]|nr:substrate-binding domain-containing protein [Deltaproteobacteria bacterium]MBW2396258.1 substrate-binding domain-containing protein [Deltaproteobacteria bacterium]